MVSLKNQEVFSKHKFANGTLYEHNMDFKIKHGQFEKQNKSCSTATSLPTEPYTKNNYEFQIKMVSLNKNEGFLTNTFTHETLYEHIFKQWSV